MEVRKALGVSQGTLSGLEGLANSSGQVTEYAKLYRVDADWLATGEGSGPAQQGDPPNGGAVVAHTVILSARSMAPRLLDWSHLMSSDLAPEFQAVVPDDAMAPEVPAGSVCFFSTTYKARPGDYILVADAKGFVYLRRMVLVQGEHWQAEALNPAFKPLDSVAAELRILAVYDGKRGRKS